MTSILAESLGILWSGGRGKQKNKNKEQNGGDKWEIVYWGGGAFRGRAELVKLVFAAADVKYWRHKRIIRGNSCESAHIARTRTRLEHLDW